MNSIFIFILIISLILLLFLVLMQRKCNYNTFGGNNEDPVHQKLTELNLTKDEAEMLSKDIIKIISEYSDNPFIISSKLDKIIQRLDKKSIENIRKNKEYIKIMLDINDNIDDIRIVEVEEEVCDLYSCPRCSAKKHTYKEVQQRAIDEPTNVKCQCKVCGFKWDQE